MDVPIVNTSASVVVTPLDVFRYNVLQYLKKLSGLPTIHNKIYELEIAMYNMSGKSVYNDLFVYVYSHLLDDVEFDMFLINRNYTVEYLLSGGSYLYLGADYTYSRRPENNNSVRAIYHRLFKSMLIGQPLFLAKYVESGCYYGAIEISKQTCNISTMCRKWDTNFKYIYEERCAVVLGVLETNPLLFDNLDIDQIYETCCKPCQILCPEVYKNELDILNIRRSQKIVEKTSNLFKCPACHGRSIVYREDQRRSLDEASGFQCKCKNCGKEFYVH